ncbi:MAG: sugar phosphate isomerase/epimerase family protein [Promethearchaeota archaeon]
MELGISSLGHIIDIARLGKFKNLKDLLYDATEKCLTFAEKSGIETIELVIDPPEVFSSEYRQRFIDLINSYSLKKQVHGPYIDLNLCSHNNRISEASIESLKESVKISYQIDAKIMTIHPGLANFMISSIREINKEQLKKAIHKLLDYINSQKLMICLENMPQNAFIMTDNKNIEEVYKIISREDLFITFDTSHFYTCNGNMKNLWTKFHQVIKNIHLVDNFSKNSDTHPPLGSGKIDFKEIFDILKSFRYKGPIIIELSSISSINQSINFIKKFL